MTTVSPARRKAIAALANQAARQGPPPRNAPHLRADSSRLRVLEWMQWCDPNGSWLDDLAIADGELPFSTGAAWEALSELLGDSYSGPFWSDE